MTPTARLPTSRGQPSTEPQPSTFFQVSSSTTGWLRGSRPRSWIRVSSRASQPRAFSSRSRLPPRLRLALDRNSELLKGLPGTLDGYRLLVEESGNFRALGT